MGSPRENNKELKMNQRKYSYFRGRRRKNNNHNHNLKTLKTVAHRELPYSSDGKESAFNAGDPACKAGDWGLVPGSGRFSGEGNGNPFQYSCLENPMDRRAWWSTVHGVTKSRTWSLSFWLTSLCIMGSSFIHLIRTDSNEFFLVAE